MPQGSWQPTQILRQVEALPTGASVVRVATDRGDAFLKALGNAAGPHALAREWVGTQLATLFGLPTFHFALYTLTADDPELILGNGARAEAGPAFITKAERGQVWAPATGLLDQLVNPEAVPRLAVFDTWIRNRDRHPPAGVVRKPNWDNVFLSAEDVPAGKFRLLAMDHSHVFAEGVELSPRLASIDAWQDNSVYGVFPEFQPLIESRPAIVARCLADLGRVPETEIRAIVQSVPREWNVDQAAREALVRFLCLRARHVSDTGFSSFCPQAELPFPP